MNGDKIFVTRSSMPPYEEYIEAIKPLWDSRWLTNMGKYHQELEGRLKEYLDVPELSLMVNGHMALEMAIQAMGLPEGGEVITTPFTFISTTHAIVRNGLKPVFCDVKPEDMNNDMRFREDLGFSSLDFMSFLGELEDTFDIELEEEDALQVHTIAAALELLEKLQ